MSKFRIASILSTAMAFVLIAGGFKNTYIPNYTAAVCTESAAELANPCIGWYRMHGYTLGSGSFDAGQVRKEAYGSGLVMLQFNLSPFARSSVSAAALRQLDDVLGAWSARGRQLIVRFLYDWDGDAPEKEPESLSLVLEHMSQTAEVVNRYAGSVYIMQGIYVGSWGEMHGSNYMGEEDMLTLVNHLASVTDPCIFLAVRTPEQWRTVTESAQPLSRDQAFGGSLAARLGLFNDGMLGSDTDVNTYAAPGVSYSLSGYGKRPRQEELLFQNELCRYVPNGGEVIISNPLNDFPSAVQDLSRAHVSYLNSAYDAAVLSKWRQAVCREDGPFNGMNGYDYISRHLGYRFVVRSSKFGFTFPKNGRGSLAITLENVGFSNCYRNFDVSLTLRRTDSGREYTTPVTVDTRLWNAGSKLTMDVLLDVNGLPSGDYKVILNISDPVSGFPVRLANEGTGADGGLSLGTLSLQKLSQVRFPVLPLVGKAQGASV